MESFFGESSTSLVELGGQRDNPNVPSGYHFRPLDRELVRNYVKKRNRGLPLPVDIPAVHDLYGCHPKTLQGNGFRDKTDDNDHKEYYFTRRKPKCGSKKKFKRSTPGEGFWKGTGKDIRIKDGNKKLIGYKRTFKFFKRKGKPTKWIVHEFRDRDEHIVDRYVLCLIYETGKKSPTSLTSIPAVNKGVTGAVEEVGESLISQSSALPYQTNPLLVNTNHFQIQSPESNIQYNPPTEESPGDNELSVSDYEITPADGFHFISNPTQSAPNNSHLVQSPELPNINDMLPKGLSEIQQLELDDNSRSSLWIFSEVGNLCSMQYPWPSPALLSQIIGVSEQSTFCM